jgi:hypothetical protein
MKEKQYEKILKKEKTGERNNKKKRGNKIL